MKVAAPSRRKQVDRSSETRQHLMDTAIALIAERSFQAATVFEIAKRAGMTTGAVQHHFPTKADLILCLVDRVLDARIEDGGIWPEAAQPLAERADAFVQALWRQSYSPARFLVSWNLYFGCSDEPEVLRHVAARRDEINAKLHARFAQTFPEVADAARSETLMQTVMSCLRGLGVHRLFGERPDMETPQLAFVTRILAQECVAAAAIGKAARRR